ncbi:MATE family efflux transporter [Zavarzinella formosa]|uniref:MATE family efflux transporter n=1 Tax=Zavarzinella formosa TaxID=360055 RepID=UPI000364DE55|nr:MATE family efflux transporter [Zavarzinella formosa]
MSNSETTTPPEPSLVTVRKPLGWLVIGLAWPVLVQQFLILSVALYDQFLAGNNPPEDPTLHIGHQAAQTTANYISWFISSASALVSVGGTALVARFVGAGERDRANRVANQSLALAFVFGIIGTPLALFALPWAVHALGLRDETAWSAVQFLQPIFFLVTFQLLEQSAIACLVGAGDTRTGPFVLGGVALLNIPMAWTCFHGFGPIPGMGFYGIGMGTALSHACGSLTVLGVLLVGRHGLRLRGADLWPDFPLIYRILRISLPASVDTLSIGLCQLWFLSLVNALGNVAATAHGTAIRCEGLGYMSGQAFATAASALVGQNLGAKRPHEAARSARVALLFGCVTMSLMGVLFFTFAPAMFHFFSPHAHQQPVVDAGVPILRLVAFAMPPLSAIIVLTGVLRGAGDTRFPILLSWIGFLAIRLPIAYLLTRDQLDLGAGIIIPGWNLGLFGAWLAMFADLMVRGALFVWRFTSGRWKTVRV